MEYAFLGSAIVLAAVWIVTVIRLVRRNRELAVLSGRITDLERRQRELQERDAEHTRKLDESRGKANQLQEELKRARKRVFELEQEKTRPAPATEADGDRSRLEAEAAEARAAARRSDEACAQIKGELEKARRRVVELEAELAAVRAAAAAAPKPPPAPATPSADHDKLEKTIAELRKKLDAAQRKARSDAQVYRVTRSKLDLALEKIAWLEKKAAPSAPPAATDESAPARAAGDPPAG